MRGISCRSSRSPSRTARRYSSRLSSGTGRAAYERYYGKFADVQHTLAATLAGSIQKDVYYAKARGYKSARAAALFSDNVPETVYDNLIATVGDALPALHRYHALRNRVLRLRKFQLFDQYVPLLPQARMRHTWNQAVDVVIDSLAPLGAEYGRVLRRGTRR